MKSDSKHREIITPDKADGNLISRRRILTGATGLLGLAAFGFKPRIADAQSSFAATPRMTEGPYFVDEKLNRSDIRVDTSNGTVAAGLPIYLAITVSSISNGAITPLSGAYVDIWHANASGVYSDVSANSTTGRKFLRGYQVTGAHGTARFITVYPGWYSGRAVHIHAKVRLFSGSTATYTYNTQLFFDDSVSDTVYRLSYYSSRGTRDTRNSGDNIYSCSTSNGLSGDIMQLRLAADSSYAVASTHLILNLSGTNPGCS